MSSGDEEQFLSAATEKRRRVERACDVCRRRKIRCEGFKGDGTKCQHCKQFGLECLDSAPKRRRGPSQGYIRVLETRLAQMEAVMKRLHPELDINEASRVSSQSSSQIPAESNDHCSPASTTSSSERQTLVDNPRPPNAERHNVPIQLSMGLSPPVISDVAQSSSSSDYTDEEDVADLDASGAMKWMVHLNPSGNDGPGGYQGESSRAKLVKDVFDLRREYLSENMPGWSVNDKMVVSNRRAEMWANLSCDTVLNPTRPEVHYTFPPPDLLSELVDIYFQTVNVGFPLLNKILFKYQVAQGLHFKDPGFGSVLLLVAAIGSRGSKDPRVYVDPKQSHSGGWVWFNQVQKSRSQFTTNSVTVYDLQFLFLTAAFMHGSSTPEAGWSAIGIGLRMATNVGAHRKKTYGNKPTVRGELWKRAFWCLLCLDRHVSNNLGRPCSLHDEDFDVDLPIECDDEYWFASGADAFKQPEGKPCQISHLIHFIKYYQLVAFVLRTIYSINHSKTFLGLVGPDWEKRIVTQCDSSLNEWRDSIPEHLRWGSENLTPEFFARAAHLEAWYYMLQITIHRPFITNSRKRASAPFPSLEICTNAARSISRILEAVYEKNLGPFPWEITAAFSSGVSLLLHIWGNKKNGLISGLAEEIDGLHTCMRTLKRCEGSWHQAAQYWDALFELASFGKLPMAADFPPRRVGGKLKVVGPKAGQQIPEVTQERKSVSSEAAQNQPVASPSSSEATTTASLPLSAGALPSYQASYELPKQVHEESGFSSAVDTQPLSDMALDPVGSSQAQWDIFSMPPIQDYPTGDLHPIMHQFPWNSPDAQLQETFLKDSAWLDPTSLWSGAPAGFEVNQWSGYIDSVGNILDQM